MEPTRLPRALIRVSGADRESFLQNLLTQDIEVLAGPRYAALLSPQGKVVADMLVWAHDSAFVIECDPARGDDLLKRLTLYKLRAQVTLEDVSATLGVAWSSAAFDGAFADPRLPELGWRALTANAATLGDGAAAYDALRLALGVPDLARDARPEEVFAGEALLDELNGVDFQKGCFVGQENVSRMKRRATTRKKFCPVTCAGAALALGATISAAGVELGQVRASTEGRALALIRLDRALEALDRGEALEAEGRAVMLDPPSWLILPQREPIDTASPD